jgi:NAD(P)-dependent dehydrogenase (short-subunit alcohol dehydrogenase family)
VRADVLEASPESFYEMIAVNLKGPYFLTQAVARWMIDQRSADPAFDGCVINISSISAEIASVNRGDYCLARAGTSMATKLWAVRLAEFAIRVYEIRPGVVATDMTSVVKDKYDKLIAAGGSPRTSAAQSRRWPAASFRTPRARSCTSTAA